MNDVGLSFGQAPPLAVPLRFFITAPLFGVAVAVLLLWAGPAAFASRWSPPLLAIVHLLTLGFITMTMCGAFLQLLPVLVGVPVWRPHTVSAVLHGLLGTGVVILATGFITANPALVAGGAVLLAAALITFVLVAASSLRHVRDATVTARLMRRALLALCVAAGLGVYQAGGALWGLRAPLAVLADVHLGWALLGWVGLLVMGVGYQVVPMFQMTPEYPAWLRVRLDSVLLFALLVWSVARFAGGRGAMIATLAAVLTLGSCAVFAGSTLRLQARRRRALPDATLWYWRLGMCGVLAAILWWCAALLVPVLATWRAYPLLLGVLILIGAILPVISGMLYKIVPFLCWLHLHRQLHDRAARSARLPSMKEFITERRARVQFGWHLAALILLLAAAVAPRWFVYPAAAGFAITCGLLSRNLIGAALHYRKLLRG